MNRPERLLAWYPRAWRDRYGEEFLALIQDTVADGRPRVGFVVRIAWAGLRERAHASGLRGDEVAGPQRRRTGALLVLWAWAGFVVAGSVLAKRAEHLPNTGALGVITGVAVVASVLVGLGALVALGSTGRFLRGGGWVEIAGHVRHAVIASAVALVAGAWLVAWARSLSPAQRNGGSLPYGVAFVVCALAVTVALALWTGVGFAIGRRVQLTSRQLAIESSLAVGVAACMAIMTVATIVWWAALSSTVPVSTGAVVLGMVVVDVIAGCGVSRTRSTT